MMILTIFSARRKKVFRGIKAILKEFKKRQDAEAQKNLVYSQNETDTGMLWFDGKKIYRKVILLPEMGKGEVYFDDVSNLKVSTYIHLYGFVQTSQNIFIPLLNSDEVDSKNNIYVSIENNKLRIATGEYRQIVNGFVVLQYTKTTN